MVYVNKSIKARIDWCRGQSTQTCAPHEREGWQAEEAGLLDALLHRDHTIEYQQLSPSVFERYALGLQFGREVLRTHQPGGHMWPEQEMHHGAHEAH